MKMCTVCFVCPIISIYDNIYVIALPVITEVAINIVIWKRLYFWVNFWIWHEIYELRIRYITNSHTLCYELFPILWTVLRKHVKTLIVTLMTQTTVM